MTPRLVRVLLHAIRDSSYLEGVVDEGFELRGTPAIEILKNKSPKRGIIGQTKNGGLVRAPDERWL